MIDEINIRRGSGMQQEPGRRTGRLYRRTEPALDLLNKQVHVVSQPTLLGALERQEITEMIPTSRA
jgi:hypothetical protein